MLEYKTRINLFKAVHKIRQFELTAYELYTKSLIKGSVHLYIGQEAVTTSTCINLNKNDSITSTHRGHGHCIAKDADKLTNSGIDASELNKIKSDIDMEISEAVEFALNNPELELNSILDDMKVTIN